ncbi:MAG: hypothetical protein HOJ85_02705 [Ilumatobacter sp.]|uniref:DUF6576 domain-containing protein n=1 Tax=Ilumatobacter sp. TaxID=1967498 RepID=UPI0037517FA4|nr:hypothetical protein [Ilumatobacter sp.]
MSDYMQAMFRRRPNDGWFRAGKYDVTTTDIMCGLAIATMFLWAASQTAFFKLVFLAPEVRNGEVWRIITWPIAEPPDFFALLGVVFFWLFGQQVEALFGRNRFLMWVLATTIIPAVALTVLGAINNEFDFTSADLGLGTLFLGGIWVYAATYPGVKWFEVVPLWAIAGVFTLLRLLQFTGSRAGGAVLFLLISVAAALVAGRSLGLATGWPIPHIDLSSVGNGSGGSPKRRKAPKQKRSRGSRGSGGGSVVDGPWQNAPAPTAPPVGPSASDQAELDGLLDKIGANGMDSLSGAEKKRLNELSKRLRNS